MTAVRGGGKLKELRALLGVTQEAMAQQTGLSAQTIKAIEAGRKTPTLDTARKIAETYGSTIDALFPAEVER